MKVMGTRRDYMRFCILILYFSIAALSFTHSDARRSMQLSKGLTHTSSIIKPTMKLNVLKRFNIDVPLTDSSNTKPYGVSSPFTLPPFDSLAPIPLPENTPPFCMYPPLTPQPPSTTIPTPIGYTPSPPPPSSFSPIFPIQNPPQSPIGIAPTAPEYSPTPNPPEIVPSPSSNVPSPPEYIPNPPIIISSPPESALSPPYYEPSPPSYVPSPPSIVPSPTGGFVPRPPSYVPSPTGGFVPSPPVFQPPVVYPPPTGHPPPHAGPSTALWCVAKPTVPDPIIQEAMNYACGSGADCASIQPEGSCFEPNTLFAHASYAFNSYWQRTRVAGGTCEFGGTAMLVTVDPSYDGCHFIYY